MDPVSAAIFIHREVSLFFDKYVRAGEESVTPCSRCRCLRTASPTTWAEASSLGFCQARRLSVGGAERERPILNEGGKSNLLRTTALSRRDEIETGPADARHSTGNADIDNILVRHDDTEIPLPRHSQNPVVQGPQMAVDTAPAGGFIGLGRIATSNYTLNHLQTMALQLVCSLLDRYTACPDSAAQHLQYTGGPGGTEKSRIIDASKDVFAARAQHHLLQITGTSGSAAVRMGGTTVHSACGLDAHRSPNKPLPPFSEAKKWMWKQKMVLVVDEISMLGGATLYDVSQHLQSLRDCPEKPFGGIPVVLLMGDFYQSG
ncbi:hypothetical protein MHUMG1_01502 [Metarhizium humberi]|uniref:ATP-dependent DNA helicase n=1 Tax=Metarhizium humberi TaxID=2596975 RepID=A0A9P8ML69_9HYPO|nr:hypothetical protein MHUMG1_01502 [Metarhizium humberi]